MGYRYQQTFLTYGTAAALAGHGLSICHNITHPMVCRTDDPNVSIGAYYIVDYTRSSLLAYHTETYGASGAYAVVDYSSLGIQFGSDERYNNPSEEYYWEEVRKVLLRPLLHEASQPPTAVILAGENSTDPTFRRVLEDILHTFYRDKSVVPLIFDRDPEYIQAKGAAEFVRRRPYLDEPRRPERTLGFWQDETSRKTQVQVDEQMDL
ncbi:hypothetical protein BDV95DRAFT_558540 [Massariosphaeria phaeospora]|uniref:Uncharacterized protein n=1 Tax=Massariosphaeria phaeospora TaxID=100035 RepID=A0A7C8MIF0_9PLEO|nr:hypothetical protein BDV95DRAFT_558540 [Massariosphaeria phaeospora]